jgi:NADPH:quinone reductase-like Zn-dependent oxidoreductase
MQTMKAVVLHEHGGPEMLVAEEIERPTPGPLEVLVEIKAVAVNHLDIWVRKGGPAFRLEYPHRLGSEIAGTIAGLGEGVEGLELGSKVVVNPGLSCGHCVECLSGRDNLCRYYEILGENCQGGYAQYICVPRHNIAALPGELSFEEAAAGLLTFLTAWQMLVTKARVQPGQTVLVQGGGSGVGVAAIQIARLHGASVIATAGTDEKVAKAIELGAEHGINYQSSDFVAEVKRITGKRGVDVVIEHVGGETLARSIHATCKGGRIVTCGATSDFQATIDLRHVFFRQVEILGSTMGSKGDLLRILPHFASGALRPVIDRVLPLERAAEAHTLLEERKAFGKIVLTP